MTVGSGPAAFKFRADIDEQAVREMAQDVINDNPKFDEAEVLSDSAAAYIASEIGHDSHPRAVELRRRLGL